MRETIHKNAYIRIVKKYAWLHTEACKSDYFLQGYHGAKLICIVCYWLLTELSSNNWSIVAFERVRTTRIISGPKLSIAHSSDKHRSKTSSVYFSKHSVLFKALSARHHPVQLFSESECCLEELEQWFCTRSWHWLSVHQSSFPSQVCTKFQFYFPSLLVELFVLIQALVMFYVLSRLVYSRRELRFQFTSCSNRLLISINLNDLI